MKPDRSCRSSRSGKVAGEKGHLTFEEFIKLSKSFLENTPLIMGNHLMNVWHAVMMKISMLLNQNQKHQMRMIFLFRKGDLHHFEI